MAGLSVVELCEELSSEGAIFADGSGGWGSMMGGRWGVDRWVGVSGYPLSIEDTEGVSAKGGVGVLVFEGLGLLFVLSVPRLLSRGWQFKGIIVQVPHWQGQVPVESGAVDVVVAASAIR